MDVKKIQAAIQWMKQGGLVIVADDEDRESEGDIIGLGSKVTPQKINFITQTARGLLCTSIGRSISERLNLTPMAQNNTDPYGTAFTVSVDYKTTTTGISAFDRATTIKALADSTTKADDFFKPGHTFPLVAKDGGVLERNGHTEASITLARLAGEAEVAYICEVMDADGHMARRPRLKEIAAEYNLPFLTIAELQEYVKNPTSKNNQFVDLPTVYGNFKIKAYVGENLALVKGPIDPNKPVLVRLHSECMTGDVFGSKRCDCGEQLHKAMQKIDHEGGILIYLRQEGRGIGLSNKLKAYALQDQGRDTYEANKILGFEPDERKYNIAKEILTDLGISKIRLLTNNPDKVTQLTKYGIEVTERVPLEIPANEINKFYLQTKRDKFHHLIMGK